MSHADHLLRLADFATSLRFDSIPEAVRERATLDPGRYRGLHRRGQSCSATTAFGALRLAGSLLHRHNHFDAAGRRRVREWRGVDMARSR